MITLYQFPTQWGLPNLSPYCLKIETFLRMAELPYKIHWTLNTKNAPKGKLPYIRDNNKIIADSNFIIDYLNESYHINLDRDLSPEQLGFSRALQRWLEEFLYWCGVHFRWKNDAGWKIIQPAFFGKLSIPLRWIISPLARRGLVTQLYHQGLGRHSESEILQIVNSDIPRLSQCLGKKNFFMGKNPSTIDASAYGLLANLIEVPVESPMKAIACQQQNLVDYCRRMKARFFPEE